MDIRIERGYRNYTCINRRVISYRKSFLGLFSYWDRLPLMDYKFGEYNKVVYFTIDTERGFSNQEEAESWLRKMFSEPYKKFNSGEEYLEKYNEVLAEEERLKRAELAKEKDRELKNGRVITI